MPFLASLALNISWVHLTWSNKKKNMNTFLYLLIQLRVDFFLLLYLIVTLPCYILKFNFMNIQNKSGGNPVYCTHFATHSGAVSGASVSDLDEFLLRGARQKWIMDSRRSRPALVWWNVHQTHIRTRRIEGNRWMFYCDLQ